MISDKYSIDQVSSVVLSGWNGSPVASFQKAYSYGFPGESVTFIKAYMDIDGVPKYVFTIREVDPNALGVATIRYVTTSDPNFGKNVTEAAVPSFRQPVISALVRQTLKFILFSCMPPTEYQNRMISLIYTKKKEQEEIIQWFSPCNILAEPLFYTSVLIYLDEDEYERIRKLYG